MSHPPRELQSGTTWIAPRAWAREIERSDSCGRNPCAEPGGGGFSRKQTIVRLRAWREGGFLLQRGERIQKFLPGSKDEHECTDVELLNTPQTAFIGRRSRASMVKPHRVILISSILLDIQRSVRPDRDLGQANDCSFQSMRFKLRVSFRSKPSCHGQNTSVRLPQKGTWTDEACASVSPRDRRRR
jgi:hypothetical protein